MEQIDCESKQHRTTHYDVLGVPESADGDTVKQAFRTLVLRHHPDKSMDKSSNRDDTDHINRIQKAYRVLRDEMKRKQYDEELRLERQRIQSRLESAIVLEQSDCILERDEDGLSALVFPCRCGAYLDTSPLDDDEITDGTDEIECLLECPGCSLVYDTRKLSHDHLR